MIKVVVCLPCFNAEATIARTLDTILAQDYPIYKIKVFDNISSDTTRDIIKGYAQRNSNIELFVNDKNLGAEGNFTRSIQAAEEDYTAIVHADDLYEPNFISESIKVLEMNPGSVASFCGAWEINHAEKIVGERFMPPELLNSSVSVLDEPKLLSLIFKYGNFITCPSVVVKSDVYRNYIKIWNGERYKTSADLDVWMRLSKVGRLACIKEKLIRYRVADASFSYRIARKRTGRHDLFLVLDELKNSSMVTGKDIENFHYLILKDQSSRCLNIIRNKKRDVFFPVDSNFNLLLVLKKMFSSKWHFKMSLSIVGIYFISRLFLVVGWSKACKK